MGKKDVLDVNNSIWSIEASRILGISKKTFWTRLHKGIYKIKCVRCPKGFRYSIHDVVKIAHPTLNDKEIEEFIMKYRENLSEKKKLNKKRLVKQDFCK